MINERLCHIYKIKTPLFVIPDQEFSLNERFDTIIDHVRRRDETFLQTMNDLSNQTIVLEFKRTK